jgi:pilus assembly protein CpaF
LQRVRTGLAEQVTPDQLFRPSAETRARVRALIEQELAALVEEVRRTGKTLAEYDPAELVKTLEDELLGLGQLQPFLEDEAVEEILVNGTRDVFVIRAGGRKDRYPPIMADADALLALINTAIAHTQRSCSLQDPIVDAALQDGSRVNVTIAPIAEPSPTITIRRFRVVARTMPDLLTLGTVTPPVARFLQLAITARLNILVTGGTASGKTNLLNVLCSLVDPRERIVTIEDTPELQLPLADVVRLVTLTPRADGSGGVDQTRLLANALRLRPDRIIMGEARDRAAWDMINAANTGHEGLLATIHADSASRALDRLQALAYRAVPELPEQTMREEIAAAFHIIVFIARQPDGQRRILEVLEVPGNMEQGRILRQPLFVDHRDGQGLQWTGVTPVGNAADRLNAKGLDFMSVLRGG